MARTKKAGTGRIISCIECAGEFEAFQHNAKFCGAACNTEFTKRRNLRGAVLYDLMMINRHEREIAKKFKIWFLVTRVLMYWREEDKRTRDGRPTWNKAADAVEKVTYAFATVVHRGK